MMDKGDFTNIMCLVTAVVTKRVTSAQIQMDRPAEVMEFWESQCRENSIDESVLLLFFLII